MGPRGVGNPPHSSLPPPHPPDSSQFKLKLQTHKDEVAARFGKLGQSMTNFATEQERFQRELREELRQLRLIHGAPSSPQPHSNPPTTTISAPPPSSSAGTPSSPSYCQSQLRKCQLPQPLLLLNGKPQSQTLDPKPLASFTLLQDPFHTSPPRTVPPSLPPLMKPTSIPEAIKPKFHSPKTLGTQAITHKGCVGVWQRGRIETQANNQGHRTTPSYVAFTDTECLIGKVAKNQVAMNLINSVSNAKRLIGRKFSDSSVQGDMSLWPFKVFDKPMINVAYKSEKKQITAEEILSMVLIKMQEIQVILEGLKIRKDHELEHCFSGVDKRVRDKGGGHTFQLGNNLKVITTLSHDPQYWKSVLNGYNWCVFKHRSEHIMHTGNALLNINYKVLLNGNGWQLVTEIALMKLKVDKALMISSIVSYDGTGHQFILMVIEQIKYVFNKLCAGLQTQEEMKTISYKMVKAPKSDTWAGHICINGLKSTVLIFIEFKWINFNVGYWSVVQFIGVFIKLFVKVLIFETSVEEICVKELSVKFLGNYMESNGQCFREPFSSLQFCESSVNLNMLKAQFRSSNKGGFTYDMRLENWTERTAGSSSKLSVRQGTKGSGKSEVFIFDQETNFQQRVFHLEKVTAPLKNNFGLSFARYLSVLITSMVSVGTVTTLLTFLDDENLQIHQLGPHMVNTVKAYTASFSHVMNKNSVAVFGINSRTLGTCSLVISIGAFEVILTSQDSLEKEDSNHAWPFFILKLSLIGLCSKEQQKIYKDWFNLVDSDGDGGITGNEGVKFFAMSNLSRPELKQVWAIADSKRQRLLRFTEFVTAMQLISVAQEHELSLDILKFEVDWENITPPVIEGLDAFIAKTKSSTTNGIAMNGITPNQPSSQWSALKSVKKLPLNVVTSIVDGLKRLYIEKLKSLEVAYHFNDFGNPFLTHSVFDAKLMVMLLGQYEVDCHLQGKNTLLALLKQNLHKAQERIKLFHDKWHTVRTFEVGDLVYMKLQSHKQQSVEKRTVHKLSVKYYRPFEVIAKVLDTMLVKRKGRNSAKWQIQWLGTSIEESTWEEAVSILQRYLDFQT